MTTHNAHQDDEQYIKELYCVAAREAEDQWVRELLGVDRPVSKQECEQAMEDLLTRWGLF